MHQAWGIFGFNHVDLKYGSDDAPHGHMHIRFRDVRVTKHCILVGEGHGFRIAQSCPGPGRIHHCMRAIGQAEKALKFMCERSLSQNAFGQPLARLGANFDIIAQSRIEIEATRLLCLKNADRPRRSLGRGPLDQHGQNPNSQDCTKSY